MQWTQLLLDFIISCHSAGNHHRIRCIDFARSCLQSGEMNLWKRFINQSAVSREANEFSEANFPLESAASLIYCNFSSNLGEFLILAARRAETFLCPLLINSFDCNCTKWRCCRDEFIMTEFIWWGEMGFAADFKGKRPVWSSGSTGVEACWLILIKKKSW